VNYEKKKTGFFMTHRVVAHALWDHTYLLLTQVNTEYCVYWNLPKCGKEKVGENSCVARYVRL